jgi:hypothetical protein
VDAHGSGHPGCHGFPRAADLKIKRPFALLAWDAYHSVGIPAKLNAHSEWNPNGIPG